MQNDSHDEEAESLRQRIEDAGGVGGREDFSQNASMRGRAMGIAMRLSATLLVAVGIGALMGWLIDSWLGTAPFGLVVFFLLGFASGIAQIMRMAMAMQNMGGANDDAG